MLDACKVEGCGRIRRVFVVDIPMLRGSLIFIFPLLLGIVLLMIFPQIALFLPALMK